MSVTTVLLSNRQMGDVNRSRVLSALCDHGPLSRAELARLAGVPRATIGTIAQGLVDDGLLEESEPVRGSGKVGKPGRPLWFRRDAGICAAVAFGSDAVEAALVNARGDVLIRVEVPCDTARAGSDELVAAVLEGVARAVTGAPAAVLGIGVAVPGVCDPATGTVVGSGPVPGARGRALATALEQAHALPVLVDNDARAQALGEKWFGDGRGVATFASVQTGSGLGVGLVLDGELYRGADGATGELGHTVVALDGEPCSCGLVGCWETVATLRWLRTEAAALGLPGAVSLDAAALVALDSDPARALLARYADHLAVGLVTLVHLLAPTRLLLHGDVVGGGEVLRALVAERVAARSLPHVRESVEVLLSSLDQDASLLGAAGLVLSQRFTLAA
ncbi:MAG: ROK family transcriptional regulator [Mycobacteriales bacterium]|nr:ROK family transcriptional regulator [Mycobacteriales bacterium]